MNVNVNVNVGVRVTVSARVSVSVNAGLWDQQRRARSECECECGCACYCACACECECECVSRMFQMRWVARRFTPVCRSRCGTRGRSAAPAPGGSYGLWDHSPCVWFLVCGPIETTLPTGLWDQQRRARSECECECELVCECECECECGCACYCEGARRCEARRCEVRAMGPRRLCVVLLVQAYRNDPSDRAMGPAAE